MAEIAPRNLRTLIVGAGLMGAWHADAARRLGANVVAIVDPDQTRGEALAEKMSAAYSSDLALALRDNDIDVTHICSPLQFHVQQVKTALMYGSHVLSEKPLAVTAAEVQDLMDYAQQQQLLVIPVHQFPFQRGVDKAVKALPKLGAIQQFQFVASTAGATHNPSLTDDDLLLEILPHPLSLIQRLFPDWTPLRWTINPRAHCGALLMTAIHGETQVVIDMSTRRRPTECWARVAGENGHVYIDLFHGYSVFSSGQTSRFNKLISPLQQSGKQFVTAVINLLYRTVHWEPAYPGLRALIAQVYDAIRGHAPPFTQDQIITLYSTHASISNEVRHR